MRMIRYYVVCKKTRKTIYSDCRESKCKAFIESQSNSEDYAIGYKWLSI